MPAPSLIATTDTFNDWFNATNNLISFVSNTSQVIQVGGTANGNVSINGTMTVSNLVVNASANLVGLLVNTTAVSVPVPTTIAGNLIISAADLSVGRNLSVTANTAVGKDLTVGGNASVTGNVAVSGAVYVGSNVTVGLSSTTIGNTTANTVRTATSFVVSNSTNSATLTSTSLTIGAQVLNTSGLSVNSATVTGPLTANGLVGDSGQVLTSNGNGLYWSTLDPGANNTGGTGSIQYYNGTKFGSSANLIFTGTAITVGNSSANGSYGQNSVTVANTGGSASLTPIALTVGTQVVNTTGMYVGSTVTLNAVGMYVGSNVTLNTTAVFVGNSSANVIQSATSLRVANTTNTSSLTPLGLTIGTTVVNTSAASFGGTLSVTGAANALGNLGVTGILSVTANAVFKTNVLYVDTTNNRVGVNNSAPAQALTVNGTTQSTRVTTSVVTLTDGATVALDASAGSVFKLSAGGNRTILAPTNAVDGQKIVIKHFASGSAWTLSLTTGAGGFAFGDDITGLTATTSGKSDYIGCIYDATASRWYVVGCVKGY